MRYDRIGDIIVTTPLFRILKKANPQLMVGVLASPSNAELVANNPHIDRIHILQKNLFALGKELGNAQKERYDVVLNLIFNRTTSGGLLANLIARRGIKIGQGADKYRFYFNVQLHLDRGTRHMAEVVLRMVETVFAIPVERNDEKMELFVDHGSSASVAHFLERKGVRARTSRKRGRRPFVVVNLSATEEPRRISRDQSLTIVQLLAHKMSLNTIVISAPNDRAWRVSVVHDVKSTHCWTFPDSGDAHLEEIVSLISSAAAVITPDTSIVHIASATGTPVLGLFTPMQVTAEWLPYKVRHKALFAASGSPVSSIPLSDIRNEVTEFITRVAKV